MSSHRAPLAGLRVIESAILGPAGVTTSLADLGADVNKVESPAGDYIREITWPVIEGVSLMHYHLNRGKRSLALDLRNAAAQQIYRDLIARADVVLEGSRPGFLARYGLGYETLRGVNPRIVFCSVSGYGSSGPYKDLPAHGIAFDIWAGTFAPAYDSEGFCYIPEHVGIGINAAPLYAAIAILAAVVRARETGAGCCMELAQSDAAAAFDWYRSESHLAYARPENVVTGNKADGYRRRPVGTAGMKEGVRYQLYESADGYVLFMAAEQMFWRNFCQGIGRLDLYERWPGNKNADHASGNRELRGILREIFRSRSTSDWLRFGIEFNTPIGPVNTPQSLAEDPQFKARFTLLPHREHGADMLGFPVKFLDEPLQSPRRAPKVGEQSEEVLREILSYGAEQMSAARTAGAFGA